MVKVKVELNKKTANPFYGMRNTLELYQNAGKGVLLPHVLGSCWQEVSGSKEGREMFFSLLFSIGDITARQHNLFGKKKVDSGGNAQRGAFETALNWLKANNYPQFRKFLLAHLFDEYTSFDTLFSNRVKTTKGKQKVEKLTTSLIGSEEYLEDLSNFVVSVIKGNNPTHKHFLAKFLTRPRTSKRSRSKKMLPETKNLMQGKERFLKIVSEKAGLAMVKKTTHTEFTGYIEWRKQYIGDLESVLFSEGRIKEFDEQQFMLFLEKLPASARHRVRCRLLNKDNTLKMTPTKNTEGEKVEIVKWPNLGNWFLTWEKFKEKKQKETRVLEEKIRQQGGASIEEQAQLTTLKKEAKVTVGAVNFQGMFKDIISGNIDRLKIQPFLDKVNLPYNNLVIVDESGSMRSNSYQGITAFDFATFMATICLMKNPDDVGRSLIGFFSCNTRLFATMSAKSNAPNSILKGVIQATSEPLIIPEQHFLDNLQRMRQFANAVRRNQYTNIASIPDDIYKQCGNDPHVKEQLQSFPVWTVCTDGNFNQMHSPEASMNDFFRKCDNYFGFRPFVIAIDVASTTSAATASRFSGIDNFMFIPPNPAQIEQLLTNFKDIDVMDVYTPLQSLHRSNRYELVRNHTI